MKRFLALLLCFACLLSCGCGAVKDPEKEEGTKPAYPADTETTLGPSEEEETVPTVAETLPPTPAEPVITAEEYTREIIKEADAGTFLTHHSIRCWLSLVWLHVVAASNSILHLIYQGSLLVKG